MKSAPQIVTKTPGDCSAIEIRDFIALITAGGEVVTVGLEQRVRRAAQLALLLLSGRLLGTAALKNPSPHYRDYVASSAGAILPMVSTPYELGWVFVDPLVRGNGYGRSLSKAAVAFAKNNGVFATSRTENIQMHHTLDTLGFARVGEPFNSQNGEHRLQLFTREPSNNSRMDSSHN